MATRSDLFCTLLAAVIGVLASPAGAQEPARPATTPAQPSQIEKLLQAYRSAPVADMIVIRVKDDTGAEKRSNIIFRNCPAQPPAPQRTLLELGAVQLYIAGKALVATDRAAQGRFAEFRLADKPLAEALTEFAPRLTVPQLILCDPTVTELGDLCLTPPGQQAAAVRWDPPVADRVTGKTVMNGSSPVGKFKLVMDRTSSRLVSVTATYDAGPIRQIELLVRAVNPSDPAGWEVKTADRTRVASLAELQSSEEPMKIGAVPPFDGKLVTSGFSVWEVRRQNQPVVYAFVQIRPDGLLAADQDSRDAAYNRLKRECGDSVGLVRALKDPQDRWNAVSVAILDGVFVKPEITSSLLAILNPSDSSVLRELPNPPLFTTPGAVDQGAFADRATTAVVVDKRGIVRAIFPITDVAETAAKIRQLLESLD